MIGSKQRLHRWLSGATRPDMNCRALLFGRYKSGGGDSCLLDNSFHVSFKITDILVMAIPSNIQLTVDILFFTLRSFMNHCFTVKILVNGKCLIFYR